MQTFRVEHGPQVIWKNVGDHLENAWDHHFENVPGFSTYRLTLDPL